MIDQVAAKVARRGILTVLLGGLRQTEITAAGCQLC